MDLRLARKIAIEMLQQHGLSGWKFSFDRSKRRFGCCNHTHRRISMSANLVQLNDLESMKDTMAHEIAHALTPGKGHSAVWKKKALELGASPDRCFDETIKVPEAHYLGVCPVCGRSVKRFRRSKVACGACCRKFNGGRYSSEFRIVFKRISA